LINDLFAGLRQQGLKAGAYFSLYEWFNPLYIGPEPHQYVDQIMLPQMFDLVTRYQPDIIWADGDWMQTSAFWNSTFFLSWLLDNSTNKAQVAINDRWGSDCRGVHGGFYTAEYSDQYWLDHKWEANLGIDVHSYGYNRNSQAGNYSSSTDLIHLLIKTVAFGGNLLLDIGPRWDGGIPVVMEERLLAIGAWLKLNGEAIYGSQTWTTQSEKNSTVFYTVQKTTQLLYATLTDWPLTGWITFCAPKPTAQTVITLLGWKKNVVYSMVGNCMDLRLIDIEVDQLPSTIAWTFKITNVSNFS